MRWNRCWMLIGLIMTLGHCSFPPPTMPSSQPSADPNFTNTSGQKATVASLEAQLAQTTSRLEELQNQVNTLQGKSEVLGFEIQELRQQAANQNQDLDARLREIEAVQLADGTRIAKAAAVRPTVPASSTLEEMTLPATGAKVATAQPSSAAAANANIQQTIQDMFEAQSWDASIIQLEGWAKANAVDPNRADVLLAIGQGYYEKKDYPRSIQALQSTVDEFPQSKQACEARYYQGQAFVGLKDNKNAALFFQETIELCPKHPAKDKANKALQAINA